MSYIDVLSNYHLQRRKKKYAEKGAVIRGIGIHSVCHDVLLPVIKLLRKLRKQKLIILGDKRNSRKNKIVYAITHIGGNDVEITFEAVKSPAWLFLGDPRELYCNLDGMMLFLNGAICIETRDKEDRQIAKAHAIELLKKGGNLIIYPEGAWNLSENLLLQPLYSGTLEVAKESGAEVVPVAIEKYEDTYYANIGANIDVSQMDLSDKAVATNILRDTMATLKWEILEHVGMVSRESIPPNYSNTFVNEIMNIKEISYSIKDINEGVYRPKGVVTPEEAFGPIRALDVWGNKIKIR